MINFFLFLSHAIAQPDSSNCRQGLVASFPFNGNANDVSGNGNNGIIGNTPTLTTDRFGHPNSAYLFGGFYDPDWIRIPNSKTLQFDSAFSVSLWFKQCSFGGMDGYGKYSPNGYDILFSKAGDGIDADPGIWSTTYTSAANLLAVGFNNKNGKGRNKPVNFAGDAGFACFDTCEWVHYVVVINGNELRMYFDGKLQKQQAIKKADFSAANKEDFFIGRMNGGGTIWYPFGGVIDDVNIYNTALTQSQVDCLYGGYINAYKAVPSASITSSSNNICPGTAVTFTCTTYNGGNAPVYQWLLNGQKVGSGRPVYKNTSPGDNDAVSCFLTSNAGCSIDTATSNTITVHVTAAAPAITVSADPGDTVCSGTPVIFAPLSSNGNYGSGYKWFVNGNYAGTDIFTTSSLRDGDSVNCIAGADITCGLPDTLPAVYMTVYPSPAIIFKPDTVYVSGNSGVTLTPSISGIVTTYQWSPSDGLFPFNSVASPVANPLKSTTYQLTVNSQQGCAATGKVTVFARLPLLIPNSFTPNGDGHNDIFRVPPGVPLSLQELDVFDRWGNRVFVSNDINRGWDGTFNSRRSNPGTYIYLIRGTNTTTGTAVSLKGTVVLMR